MARRALGALTSRDRLVLAAKAAGAATIAWLIARSMPGFLDQYAFYAPFGAVVAMMPSAVESLRTGWQTVLGLLIGGALAIGTIAIGLHGLVTVPLIVIVAILVGGMLPPGPGRDYVPVAAIFVLIAGGGDAEAYGIAYVVLTGMGVVIGAAVNLTVLPPLRTVPVETHLESLRSATARLLDDLADAMEDAEQPPVSIEERAAGLQAVADDVRDALWDAQRTRRANLRARGGRFAVSGSERALGSLQAGVRDLTALASVVSEERVTPDVPDALSVEARVAVAEALRALAIAQVGGEQESGAVASTSQRARGLLLSWEPPTRAAAAAVGAIAHHLGALEQQATGRRPGDA
ncbi:hypothetical protein GCM10009846_26870 [Agrococcus versicolor]|uniref:FUSC family protein n=1 Tax=Agrococcus versicolor TaxID=501482 RepID=A0ABP5MRQ2_9MICO